MALCAFLLRLIGLDHTPHVDELYHVLAGRSLLEDGSLRLSPDGVLYTRALPFTYLVAGSMALFGDGLAAARLPAVVAGALLAGAVFLAVRRYGDPLAAWLAAGLVALAPTDLYLSQLVRFYTLHALLVWLVAIAVYALVSEPARLDRRSLLLVAVAALGLPLAFRLQPSTALAAAGIAVAAAPVAAWTHRARLRSAPAWAWGLGAVAFAAAAAWLVFGGLGAKLLGAYRPDDAVVVGRDPGSRFYFDYFSRLLGGLWDALPLLALVAASRRPRFVVYLGLLALVSFVGVSFSSWRHERYVYFALPAVYAVAALGFSTVIRWVRDALGVRLAGVLPRARSRLAATGLTALGAFAAAAFAAPTIDAASYTYRMLTVDDADWWLGGHFRGEADWGAAAAALADRLAPDVTLVATSPQKATYYFDDLDFVLLARAVPRRGGYPAEPGIDRQFDRPEIASADAVLAVMACRPRGVIVSETREWRRPVGVPSGTADVIERHARPVALPSGARILAFAWSPAEAPAAPPSGWACGPGGGVVRDQRGVVRRRGVAPRGHSAPVAAHATRTARILPAITGHRNGSATARTRSASQRSGRFANSRSAAAIVSGSESARMTPLRPSATASTAPPARLQTTGVPAADASMYTMPNPSTSDALARDARMNTSLSP